MPTLAAICHIVITELSVPIFHRPLTEVGSNSLSGKAYSDLLYSLGGYTVILAPVIAFSEA